MSKTTIIIVDNNPNLRLAIRQLVGSNFPHARILEADGQADAIAMVDRQPDAVVIASIHLPAGSGFSLADELKKRSPRTPIILMTGNDLPEFEMAAGEKGIAHLLSKRKSGAHELIMALHDCLNASRS